MYLSVLNEKKNDAGHYPSALNLFFSQGILRRIKNVVFSYLFNLILVKCVQAH